MPLPPDVKEFLFKTIKDDVSIEEFETWLYANKNIEELFGAKLYLDLISLNYKKGGAKYDLWNLLTEIIDIGEFETYKMVGLLNEALNKTDRLPFILMEFYDLYCNGYSFLDDLGLGYGLIISVPTTVNYNKNWEELTAGEQQKLLKGFYPSLDVEINRVKDWLISKKIVLTGMQDELGHYDFEDFRNDTEKKSKLWITIAEDKQKGTAIAENIIFDKLTPKKWWEFWK